MATLHLRFEGISRDVPLHDAPTTLDRNQIKQIAARTLEIPASRLEESVVEQHPNGNWTLRPPAVFG